MKKLICFLRLLHLYLKILARISRLIRNDDFREKLLGAKTPAEVLELIDFEEKN